MTEQINQESNDSVETPKDATDVFTEMLDAEESNDKPEVENEEVERKQLRKLMKKHWKKNSAFSTWP